MSRRVTYYNVSYASINTNFVSTWDTTNAGSASDTIVLPMTAGVATVDWGDGTVNTSNTHTYAVGGIYTVTISGTINTFRFNNGGDRLKIIDVSNWGTFDVTNDGIFYGCTNLTITATDAPIITTLSFNNMFRECDSLTTPNFLLWDTSQVTTMTFTFFKCALFNGDLSGWDVSSVTTFYGFLRSAASFNNDSLANWQLTANPSLQEMFFYATLFNGDVDSWDTAGITSMSRTFTGCINFNRDLSGWDVSSVTTMTSLFNGTSFNKNIDGWDVSQVVDFSAMFNGSDFNQPIPSWDTSSAKNMSSMFRQCPFNQDISGFDTSLVTNMSLMFFTNSSFNQDIGSWNTSLVTNMFWMFRNATSFNQDISGWDINQVSNFTLFMQGVTLSTANYDALLVAWDAQGAMSYSGTVDFGGSTYTIGSAAETARTSLISKWGGISDGGGV